MINSIPAKTDHPVISVIANRWSPLAYSDKSVEKDKVESLLEAARWAPSSFNEQPWSYIVGFKGDEGAWGPIMENIAEVALGKRGEMECVAEK